MEEALLRSLSERYLLPFFSGAKLSPDTVRSSNREQSVAFDDPCTIHFKLRRSDTFRLELTRKQPFDQYFNRRVTEKNVVDAFVSSLIEIEPGLDQRYADDLLSTLQRKIVVKAISDRNLEPAMLLAFDRIGVWASRLYEGKPITASIGFDPSNRNGNVTLDAISREDFGLVLSNGIDTLMSFDVQGRLLSHESLPHPGQPFGYAPVRQGLVAEWSQNGRIGIVLNRLGEILILKDRNLLFARRSGRWHFLTHVPVVTQMHRPQNEDVRKAVYESCLDASFARTGACIGVVLSRNRRKWEGIVTSTSDHLYRIGSDKTRAIATMIGDRTFQQLDRRFRQELLAIDGATLVDYEGRLLAVGAILKIPGGSSGGGRLAAAIELSKLGLGIKVSQDGGILMFHDGKKEPIISVM